MTNIVGFAWESALFALRNHTMQPRKEMTLMQPKLPQDERYEQRPDGTIRRFRQQTPPAQSTYIPQPPPDEPPRRRKREKHRHRRVWLYVFALIGVAFVAVEIFRYLIEPLLVQLHIWTGGRL